MLVSVTAPRDAVRFICGMSGCLGLAQTAEAGAALLHPAKTPPRTGDAMASCCPEAPDFARGRVDCRGLDRFPTVEFSLGGGGEQIHRRRHHRERLDHDRCSLRDRRGLAAHQPISRQELIAELEKLLSYAERLPAGPVAADSADEAPVTNCLTSVFETLGF